jgi:aspartate/methionine/tyrosine aminotransferase
MSKAFSLAGIRLGWLASPSAALIARLAAARDYTTISVSQLDDQVAAYALSADVLPALLERNMALARKNLKILQQFVEEHAEVCSWIKPSAGTTAFICVRRGGVPVDDAAFCADVHAKKGVLLCPGGRCFGTNGGEFRGFIRVGYACHTEELVGGLTALGDYLKEEF